ncbi:MAG: 16S rRNA (uracil(1498)-N(3))-methyltransferase [Bdellovibrionaceae bacterium]|nr:16S rRNA (uracil(1498)-N(3))-methyltransferase [Pseudobdellovibrionaceae bacterium]
MRRYWVSSASEKVDHVSLEGDIFHHICDVCRQGLGAQFEVLTPTGFALLVEIVGVDRKRAVAKVISQRLLDPLKKPYIHLAISVPKLATLEAVVEKSVELGVYKIWPFVSDFSYFKSQKGVMQEKSKRFQKIIQGATQQTGRGTLLEMAEVGTLTETLAVFSQSSKASGIFAYEGEGGKPLHQVLPAVNTDSENIWLFVGSEGGFSQPEVEAFKKINLFPVSLGQQVLRVETACVTLLSIIKYQLDLF